MTLFEGPPSFRPEDREAREAYEQRQTDKLLRLAVDRDNARIVAEKTAKSLRAGLERIARREAGRGLKAIAEYAREVLDACEPSISTPEER